MRFRPPELFLGIFLTIAVFAMGMMFSESHQTRQTIKNQSLQAEAPKQDYGASAVASPKHSDGSPTHEQQEDKSEFWSAKLTDWLLAALTALLVLFTYRLWKSTDKLWSAGDHQYRLSKDISDRQASEIQEQLKLTRDSIEFARLEFNATHRPKLVVREAHITIPTGLTPTARVRLIVANSGVGPADIVESFVVLEFNEMGILLPLQHPDKANFFGSIRIEGGQGVEREFASDINFPRYMNEQNRQRNFPIDLAVTPKIWLRGFIVYLDNNRTIRRMSFCRGCDFRTNRFRAGDDPNYEYSD